MGYIFNNFFTATLFVSPSLYFVIFGYGPPYFVANIYLMLKYGDNDDTDFVNFAVGILPFNILVTIGMFYIFQHRELMRFYELKQSEQKSQQLL